jgi:hypothetical protein
MISIGREGPSFRLNDIVNQSSRLFTALRVERIETWRICPRRERRFGFGTGRGLAAVRDYLKTIRFGSIALTIHDGRIVQLDVTEKKRLAASAA